MRHRFELWLREKLGRTTAPDAAGERGAVGLPQALFYFLHPALWETFFETLGLPVVLSGPTTRRVAEQAGLVSETEHCLPVKLLDAHMDALVGRVGRVFVPRILSARRGFIACPKLGALPDAARARFGDRFDILTAEVNENSVPLRKTLMRLGRELGATVTESGNAADRASAAMQAAGQDDRPSARGGKRYLLLGHPYNLYDPYIVEPVRRGLERIGVASERIRFDRAIAADNALQWDTCAVMRETLRQMDPAVYAGAIQLSSFSCGCDSIAERLFRETAKERGIPYMVLCLDEHTAQTGLETRLEAFVDTIEGARP